VGDRPDDCAFGATMSFAIRRQFRKMRFQMIADTIRQLPDRLPMGRDCHHFGMVIAISPAPAGPGPYYSIEYDLEADLRARKERR